MSNSTEEEDNTFMTSLTVAYLLQEKSAASPSTCAEVSFDFRSLFSSKHLYPLDIVIGVPLSVERTSSNPSAKIFKLFLAALVGVLSISNLVAVSEKVEVVEPVRGSTDPLVGRKRF